MEVSPASARSPRRLPWLTSRSVKLFGGALVALEHELAWGCASVARTSWGRWPIAPGSSAASQCSMILPSVIDGRCRCPPSRIDATTPCGRGWYHVGPSGHCAQIDAPCGISLRGLDKRVDDPLLAVDNRGLLLMGVPANRLNPSPAWPWLKNESKTLSGNACWVSSWVCMGVYIVFPLPCVPFPLPLDR